MKVSAVWLASVTLVAGCAAPFSQNIGPSHKVRPGMMPADVIALLGEPFDRKSIRGVEEWRYCNTRPAGDVFVVVYFHHGAVVEKATYDVDAVLRDLPEKDSRGESCLDNMTRIYGDGRKVPRRVQELRRAGSTGGG